nr:MAG TPA: hypothetical protein [Caudoviricetes sp.]
MSTIKIYNLYQLNATQSKIVRAVIQKAIDLINADPFYRKSIPKHIIKNIELKEINNPISVEDCFCIYFKYDHIDCRIKLTNNEISKELNIKYNKGKYIDNLKLSVKAHNVITFPTHHFKDIPKRSIYLEISISGDIYIKDNDIQH